MHKNLQFLVFYVSMIWHMCTSSDNELRIGRLNSEPLLMHSSCNTGIRRMSCCSLSNKGPSSQDRCHQEGNYHYRDIIMTEMASQITSLMDVFSGNLPPPVFYIMYNIYPQMQHIVNFFMISTAMMKSSNGNIFRVSGLLCGELNGGR